MPITQEDIANMALAVLDEAPIVSLEDDNKAARLCNLHFELTREAELTKHRWVFAEVTEEIIGTDTGSGDGTLNWSYELPEDALRLLPLTYDGMFFGIPISWEQRDGLLYTDQDTPRLIRYIANMTEPNDWDALFTEVLIGALAIKLAYPLTHKTGMIQIAQGAYDRALESALMANAMQRNGRLFTQSWALERGDTRFWRP